MPSNDPKILQVWSVRSINLWQPHRLCVLYWTFTANFTPPHTLQYEISCWHIPFCWAASHATQQHLKPAPKPNICWSCWSPAMLVCAGLSTMQHSSISLLPCKCQEVSMIGLKFVTPSWDNADDIIRGSCWLSCPLWCQMTSLWTASLSVYLWHVLCSLMSWLGVWKPSCFLKCLTSSCFWSASETAFK